MTRIVLLCSSGVSTSILVERMKAAAEKISFECSIEAHGVADAAKYGKLADIILLGPQVKFQKNNIEKVISCPCEVIAPQVYGLMNGEKVIQQAREALRK